MLKWLPWLLLLPACGGCPWTQISAIASSPATSCLQLTDAGGGGDPPSTGCVDPVLLGHNGCSGTLVIPASATTAGTELTFPAGAAVQFEVPLAIAAYHPDQHSDRYDFAIAAQLDGQPLTLTFTAGL